MNLTLKQLQEIREKFADFDLDNGILTSYPKLIEVEAWCTERAGYSPVTGPINKFLGLTIVPCAHLKDEEMYVTSGDIKPHDFLGFINFCEAAGINWRTILKSYQIKGVK